LRSWLLVYTPGERAAFSRKTIEQSIVEQARR
jgi:hypothetical protein